MNTLVSMKLRQVVAGSLVCLVACLVLLSGCGGTRSDGLIYARGGETITLDPGMLKEGFSVSVSVQLFEGLVKFDNGSVDYVPALATHWETSDDGLVWTFHLREGVVFHDGTTLDSGDVVMSLMRIIDEDHPHHIRGKMPYRDYTLERAIRSVEAVDNLTVNVILHEPYSPLLPTLAMFCCFISSADAIERHGPEYTSNPVGTGPYRLRDWQRNTHQIELERFDDYWGEPAVMPILTYRTIKENDVRLFSLARGEVDIIDGINPQMATQVEANPDLVLHQQPGVNLSIAYINIEEEPLTDKRVRQAMNYAVNKEAICEFLYEGYAIPMRGIFPPTVLGHDPDAEGYPYNPERARELLAEAGYPDGVEFELLAYSVPRPYNPLGARLAEAIQNDLAEVGIRASITQLEWATHLQQTLNKDFQVAMLGWSTDNGDPDNFADALLANPENRSQFRNEEFNRLSALGQRTYDLDERLSYYRQAQAIAVEEAPWIFISHFMDMAATRKTVTGFVLHPIGSHYLWPVGIPTAGDAN